MQLTKTLALATTLAAAAALPAGTLNAGGHAEVDLGAVPSGTYLSDPTHAYITFSYSHLGLSNPIIAFDDFTMTMELDNAEPTNSTINVTIDPASIVAGSDIWNDHLTGGDFFDVANHPEITFVSSSIETGDGGTYLVNGDLTIKGQSKPVSLTVTVNAAMNHPMSGNPVIGVAASSDILRSDFGMGKFAPNVSDEVVINVTAELVNGK